MCTNKEGYILIDALISCMILAVLASLCYASISSHYQIKESIHEQVQECEQQWHQYYQSVPSCVICIKEEQEAVSY